MISKSMLYTAICGLLLSTSAVVAEEKEKMLFKFGDKDTVKQWSTVNDGVMGGRSNGRFKINEDKNMEFYGNLSLENNGGFASVRSRPKKLGLSAGETLVVQIRGDGREYYLNLYEPSNRIAFSYRLPFKTKAGEWIEISLPLKDFYATSFGRRVQTKLDPSQVNSIGFMLSDKKAGPFKLEVEWGKVVTPESAE
ncbi:Complex I intermediate-associated protein 30 (CIA30) [Symmachiella dynata]|uniref:CIA30 family protein n=1 Tax=Symmachiella dynata TaxID=2527995 RepID=UPI00118C4A0F|nr:CIA30 family protein [Symmachiella dynata]QDT48939.1 Complex I intermediate-associated protein 30 (CIA30) [Symmachiella dynata]